MKSRSYASLLEHAPITWDPRIPMCSDMSLLSEQSSFLFLRFKGRGARDSCLGVVWSELEQASRSVHTCVTKAHPAARCSQQWKENPSGL